MPYLPKPYQIKKIITINPEVKLFRIKSGLNPDPGQFLEISIPGIGECPLASCSDNSQELELLTRKAGNVTAAMFQLKAKDRVFIRGPYGKGFPLEELKGKNVIMIAGGTGIAPVTSLIDHINKNRKNFKKVQIYFGFRNDKYILLSNRIKEWAKKFKVVITLNEESRNKSYEKGFIPETMDKHPPRIENSVAVLCGPEIMMQKVTEKLNKLGLTNDKIYWSMERRMECAVGNCGRCLIQDVYVCKDGPVFRYDFIKPRIENEQSSN